VRRPSRHQERDMKYILAIFIGFLLILFGIFGGLLDLIF
jgi:predicted benzoate:H+ symporter BenE